MALEIELKFALSYNTLEKLFNTLSEQGHDLKTHKHVRTYYDTDDLALHAQKSALRMESLPEGGYLQTLKISLNNPTQKTTNQNDQGVLTRHEWDVLCAEEKIDLQAFTAPEAKNTLKDLSPLIPIFTSHIARRSFLITFDGDITVEFAFDLGKITSGDKSATLCELEIELKNQHNTSADLNRIKDKIISLCDPDEISISTVSKAQRGYALFSQR